ncbi:hypothetical protein [Candidatus Rariloculus sp.]|uniref:hypothetical protein n=1 Tax=Candidatus Rariloculus sp. TaxID=3101265 RepID=UPI003D0F9546
MFEGMTEEDGLGPELVPPFEPKTGLPALFQNAERILQARVEGDTELPAWLQREFPGIAGAVIVRDAEDG